MAVTGYFCLFLPLNTRNTRPVNPVFTLIGSRHRNRPIKVAARPIELFIFVSGHSLTD